MSDVNTAPRGNSPAFPCQDNKKQIWTGMNLRDYIAMEALHAIIDSGGWGGDEGEAKYLAVSAYAIATAMLDERESYR
jgi:hypothetical protein